MGEALSPQLAETLSWFESLWAKTYLHLNEKDYAQVCGGGQWEGGWALCIVLDGRHSNTDMQPLMHVRTYVHRVCVCVSWQVGGVRI